MNERIAKLYDQAIVLTGNDEYVAGELDPVKFAELIVRECAEVADNADAMRQKWEGIGKYVRKHFGVEE